VEGVSQSAHEEGDVRILQLGAQRQERCEVQLKNLLKIKTILLLRELSIGGSLDLSKGTLLTAKTIACTTETVRSSSLWECHRQAVGLHGCIEADVGSLTLGYCTHGLREGSGGGGGPHPAGYRLWLVGWATYKLSHAAKDAIWRQAATQPRQDRRTLRPYPRYHNTSSSTTVPKAHNLKPRFAP
jgi:hypothetical protein